MRRVSVLLGLLPMLAFACDSETDPGEAFVAACEDYCDAVTSTPCGEQLQGQCGAGCEYFEQSLEGICVAEYAAAFECLADAEFECQNDFPVPTQESALDCLESAQALVECQQKAPCLRFCRARVADGCETSESACVSACEAQQQSEDFCAFDEQDLRECLADNGDACGTGPVPEDCQFDAAQHAECVGREDLCAGYCLAAKYAGCSSDAAACKASCDAARPTTCQSEYDRLIECNTDNSDICETGSPGNSVFCSYEADELMSCQTGGN